MYEIFIYFLIWGIAFFAVIPFFLSLISVFVTKHRYPSSDLEADIACVITGYKDLSLTVNLVESILKQNYSNYQIYLIADHCTATDYPIKSDKLKIIYPEPFLSSKSKSIKLAIESYQRNHTYTLVLDPDNLLEKNFLSACNRYLQNGYVVVQGMRTAKNIDTHIARLDAMSDYFYNYSHRILTCKLGSSATISGSGMIVKTEIYNQFFAIEDINKHIIAEDKLLQIFIVDQLNKKIAFANESHVFDEKVSTGAQVQRQRTRWIASFFQHFMEGLKVLVNGLYQFRWNKILFGYTLIVPPLFLMTLATFFITILGFTASIKLGIYAFICFFSVIANLFLCLMLSNTPIEVFKSIFLAPVFIFRQVIGLTRYKDTKTDFLVTEKNHSKSINEL
ncbi:MAG: glycosyltransferase family 2 protein [Cytophagales bacterium]